MRKPWNALSRDEMAVAALTSLVLAGLAVRNVVDAPTAEEAIRAAGVVSVLGLLFGYRIVSRHLSTQHDGLTLLLVGGLGVGVLLAAAPSAVDVELAVAFGALALLGAAFAVAPYVDLSTRTFGGVLVLVGTAMVAVFEHGRGLVPGALVALLGVLTVIHPEGFEEFERRADG